MTSHARADIVKRNLLIQVVYAICVLRVPCVRLAYAVAHPHVLHAQPRALRTLDAYVDLRASANPHANPHAHPAHPTKGKTARSKERKKNMGKIKDLMLGFEDEELIEEVQTQAEAGTSPEEIIEECQAAMVEIGDSFSEGELFVSDLMMAGAMFKEVTETLNPYLKSDELGSSKGKVVLGTVKDDIHDIGKDIVASMLTASGFEVIDLGVDVEPSAFVDALKESGASVLALSCLLASCYDSIRSTVDAVSEAGLREQISIVIGGGPIDEHVVEYSGADACSGPAQETVEFCEKVYA